MKCSNQPYCRQGDGNLPIDQFHWFASSRRWTTQCKICRDKSSRLAKVRRTANPKLAYKISMAQYRNLSPEKKLEYQAVKTEWKRLDRARKAARK